MDVAVSIIVYHIPLFPSVYSVHHLCMILSLAPFFSKQSVLAEQFSLSQVSGSFLLIDWLMDVGPVTSPRQP